MTRCLSSVASSLCLILSSTMAGQVAAQEAPLAPGARIRVERVTSCCTETLIGELISLTPDSLAYRDARSGRVALLPRQSIISVDQSRPDGYQTLDGAFLGFAAGALAGGLAGYGLTRSACSDPGGDCLQGLGAVFGGLTGGLIGLVAGALVGHRVQAERWERIDLPQRVGLFPLIGPRRTLSLSLRAAF
jgi:hypothetical protein